MIFYHGSAVKSFVPTFGLGKAQHDYGRGFYLTESLDLAREWAVAAYPGLHDLDMPLAVERVAASIS